MLSVGGYALMKYTPGSNTWTTLASPPFASFPSATMTRCAHTVFGNKLLFAGIVSGDSYQVWFYETANNSWTRTADSNSPFNTGVGVGVVGNTSNSNAFFAWNGNLYFDQMTLLYTIMGQQDVGEVKQGQQIFFRPYGAVAGMRLDGSSISSGYTATKDGILSTNFVRGFGAVRGWVK